jgi:hypothetical protein
MIERYIDRGWGDGMQKVSELAAKCEERAVLPELHPKNAERMLALAKEWRERRSNTWVRFEDVRDLAAWILGSAHLELHPDLYAELEELAR